MCLPQRRFGRTEIEMPILSLGGMRFQKSWKQLELSQITLDDQDKVEKILNLASKYGLNHIETARHYGTSELQIGALINQNNRLSRIIQTKIPPNKNIKKFEEELKISFERLGVNKIDLLAIHGINTPDHLFETVRPGGCMDVVKKWQRDKLIGYVGFSTHGEPSLIEKAIATNLFDYVNLHWYFINQQNTRVIQMARKNDLGVFIISPTDKGGHLHSPSEKMLELCRPLHPIVFNDLFCLRNENVHTISVGISREKDFDYHLEAVSLLSRADFFVNKIVKKLQKEYINSLGLEWSKCCYKHLPHWKNTPNNINIPVLIWLANLIEAWDMESFAKSRYQLLGNGGHWFPGNNANALDDYVSESELLRLLNKHSKPKLIIKKLRFLKDKFGGNSTKRLSKK